MRSVLNLLLMASLVVGCASANKASTYGSVGGWRVDAGPLQCIGIRPLGDKSAISIFPQELKPGQLRFILLIGDKRWTFPDEYYLVNLAFDGMEGSKAEAYVNESVMTRAARAGGMPGADQLIGAFLVYLDDRVVAAFWRATSMTLAPKPGSESEMLYFDLGDTAALRTKLNDCQRSIGAPSI